MGDPEADKLLSRAMRAVAFVKSLSEQFSADNRHRSPTRKRGRCVQKRERHIPRLRVGLHSPTGIVWR